MLPTILKTNSSGLRDAAKTLCFWALSDANCGCIFKSFHSGKRQDFLFAGCVKTKGNQSQIKLFREGYSTALNPDSANLSSHSETSDEIHKQFLRKHNITITGKDTPPPALSVEEAAFPDFITKILSKYGVVTPTPIQSVAWPVALSGRDFVGISPTGSGKTLAFAIPAVMQVERMKKKGQKEKNSPFAMILAPTRELVQQIEEVIRWFQGPSMRCVAVFGGSSKAKQLMQIFRGVDILVATPGRCYDLLSNGDISLDMCSFLVLDEADRMLDMGFLPQIEPIIQCTPNERQSLMWSATWPKEVVEIASKFLTDYIHICVGSVDMKPSENVNQTIVMCEHLRQKFDKLLKILNEITQSEDTKVLIFAEKKSFVDNLKHMLQSKGFQVSSVHGDKSQRSRDGALTNFRTGRIKILVATAVAARGLDVDSITHVVNYDCPRESEEYIHKIGRTGRLEKKGEAITFVTPQDEFAGYLIDMLKQCNQQVPDELLKFQKFPKINRYNFQGKGTEFSFKKRPQRFERTPFRRKYYDSD